MSSKISRKLTDEIDFKNITKRLTYENPSNTPQSITSEISMSENSNIEDNLNNNFIRSSKTKKENSFLITLKSCKDSP